MGKIGLETGEISIPLQAPSTALQAELDAEMKKLGLI